MKDWIFTFSSMFRKFWQSLANSRVANRAQVLGTILAFFIALVAFVWPDRVSEHINTLRQSATATEEAMVAIEGVAQTLEEQAKRTVSPLQQLTDLGYQISYFDSASEMFSRAISDGNSKAANLIVDANLRLEHSVIIDNDLPIDVWEKLVGYRNWPNGMDTCNQAAFLTLRSLEGSRHQNFLFLQAECADIVRDKLHVEDSAIHASLEQKVQRDRDAAEEQARANNLAMAAEQRCFQYYTSSDFRFEMEAALVEYILTNGKRWNPPKFELTANEKDAVYPGYDYYPHYQQLLNYANRGELGVLRGRLALNRPKRISSVNEAFEYALNGWPEADCGQIEAISQR
ncbi:hypothetical protein [Parasedimentitalea huanghaiensis]|uniref:Uncharacterized protein n=1 Tax=Parasedimentitalea huanghaiensis TaxID=2682100 RepID=A0A6L6WGC5_9RHOB|nr:hypothetical protein [Zongyanglinia huanghaiensis]MVO15097.1 hypothetical protein [Zongyanglinia huanghaiensis]